MAAASRIHGLDDVVMQDSPMSIHDVATAGTCKVRAFSPRPYQNGQEGRTGAFSIDAYTELIRLQRPTPGDTT
jgi:hypothetical protein